MKIIKNFISLTLLFFIQTAILGSNLTMTITNNTGYPCNFIDNIDPSVAIAVANGASLTHTFSSNSINYSFGPSVTKLTGVDLLRGTVNYNSTNNSLELTNPSSVWLNNAPFQIYLYDNASNYIILNIFN